MKRRDFLMKTTIAGSAMLAINESKAAWRPQKKKPSSVLIIGAGFSGLAAAKKLMQNGIQVTILESRNRIGGRVFSHQPTQAGKQIIELGAEWVGNSHERIISLCREFGLSLDNNQFETDLSYQGQYKKAGAWTFSPEMQRFWDEIAAIWEKMPESEKQSLDKTDWWRILSQRGFKEDDIMLRELIDSTDFGESIRHVSGYAAFAEYAESSEKNEMDLKIKGGNSLLATKMAESVGLHRIKLEHSVARVEQNTTGVTLFCTNGKSFAADYVICTAPTFSLLKIDWSAKLPVKYVEALHALQYARIGKFPMVFNQRFWGRDDFDMITDTPAHYFYHGTKNQPGSTGVLMCYAIGEKADVLASVTSKQRKDIILEALKPAFGNVAPFLKEDLMYYWGKDQYSAGAYALYGKNQWFEIMPILKQPHERVYFAGEHLADWQGFMEGAINSGEEAADLVIGN